MNRFRLAILAICALLSTSIEPLAWMSPNAAPVPVALPVVSAGPAVGHERVVAETKIAPTSDALEADEPHPDLAIVEAIHRRLSARHTGLGDRERLLVARTILAEARMHDLDPDLVIAVIEVESAGYNLAVSHVGAMGLMQLLPSTAEELAGKLDIEWKGDDTLFDPVVNVQLGTAYLRQLANQFGDVNTALAAYNWGPGSINRRLRRGHGLPSKYIQQVRQAYDRQTTLASRRS